ncbi:hypothetical protein DSO57_1020313 [Entomophthora muscae]|uniref:Uncharacterized protein n=1 Tax=Entomophthora muscae TaxID=34485 RepID=A0ACC2TRQ5_9FUNG|nr:hypothetical protein DSO57_1020313 [Entomophthora muscae]
MLLWLIQLLSYFVFAVYQFSLRSPSPPAPLPAVFRPPGAPFRPVHFTDYPLKPKYKDYTPEKILELDPLAHIKSTIRYNCQGLWIFSTPKLFRGKFNYLLAYNIYMKPPVTPKPMQSPPLSFQSLIPASFLSNFCSTIYHTSQPQETTDRPPELYCPPGAPFGLVHFTEYTPNPVYSEFTLEEILLHNPKAWTRETEVIGCEGTWITIPPAFLRQTQLPACLPGTDDSP